MFNNFKIGKLAMIGLICTSLVTVSEIKTAQANPLACKSNNGHGNNQTTELTEVRLVDIYLDDGETYILDYVVGTIDPSNPSHSALNVIDIYVDGFQVKYNNLLDFQIIELLDRIKAVEDIELTGNSSNLENCNHDADEPNDNPDLVDNHPKQPDEEPLEVVFYAD